MPTRAADPLLARIQADAELIAARFELRYRVIEAERPRVKRRYGVCFSDGTIRIRLRHAVTGAPLKYSSLVSTLCHELAHLRHFNHGLRFQRLYAQILAFARESGVYQPGSAVGASAGSEPAFLPARPAQRAGPLQLALFGGEEAARSG